MTLELHSRVAGEEHAGAAGPVILLHGLFGSLDNLGMVARQLASRYPVHSLDLRNHGRSPHADSMSYQEMAGDVLAYMDRNGLRDAALLGHSMGGKVAMRLALEAPERVSRLVVADIAPVQYEPHHDAILDGMLALRPESLASRKEADQALQAHISEPSVRQFLLKNLVRRGSGFAWRLNLAAIEACYPQIVAGEEGTRDVYPGPALFIKGGDSDYIEEQHRDIIARLFPEAALRVIPDTGHWLHAEKSDLFNGLCERFLAGEMDR